MPYRTMPWKSVFFYILLFQPVAFAESTSELMQFEENASSYHEDDKDDRENSTHHHSEKNGQKYTQAVSDDNDRDFSDSIAEGIFEGILKLLYYGGKYSLDRVRQAPYSPETQSATPRELGDRVIPFVRLDVLYNYVNSDIHAFCERIEIGYGPIGFQARAAQYRESEPSASLDIKQYLWLYRMSLGDDAELDLGLGRYELSGISTHSGGSSTIRFMLYPTDHVGIELHPSWASINGNSIGDHSAAITYGERNWSAVVGYHWLSAPGSSLNGPFLGFTLRL